MRMVSPSGGSRLTEMSETVRTELARGEPLASKLERNAAEDMIVNHLCVLAAASIGRQENPRHLEMLLNTVLPPAQRVDYFS